MTPTLCAIIPSEGIPAFGRNESRCHYHNDHGEFCIQKSKQERQTEPVVCVAVQRVIYPERRAAHEPNITTASQGLGNSGVNKREADVPPLSRSLLAEAAVAGITVNNQGEAANKQREGGENNHSDGKQQALVCLHALNHMLCHIRAVVAIVVVVICFTGITWNKHRLGVNLSPLKCKAAEAAALLHQTSLFFCDNGIWAVNARLCGRKDKKAPYCGANNYQASSSCLPF